MILSGRAGGPIRIEYLKSRRVVRLWMGETKEVQPVELTLAEFCEQLSIEPRLLVGDRCFLLFAGPLDARSGGRHGLVGVFGCESEAREGFISLRCRKGAEAEWGQLVAIDETSGVRVLAWFGAAPGPSMNGNGGAPSTPSADGRPPHAAVPSPVPSRATGGRRLSDEPVD